MEQSKDEELEARAFGLIERHWLRIVLIIWLAFVVGHIYSEWSNIRFFNLSDTDDNMRMMQVRALLHGQGWFDLRQYRLNPPFDPIKVEGREGRGIEPGSRVAMQVKLGVSRTVKREASVVRRRCTRSRNVPTSSVSKATTNSWSSRPNE